LGALLHGNPTIIIPAALQRDTKEMARFIFLHKISHITITPSLLNAMLQYNESNKWLSSLRMVIVGGETLTRQLYEAFRQCLPHAVMVNDFGATEVNTILHAAFTPAQKAHEINPVSGYPIANVKAFILDAEMQLLPPGVPGELYVGGHSLAAGYYGNNALTESRFPVHAALGRLYRTGDMGLLLPGGEIMMKGRVDGAIKINGFLVETAQVEQVLQGLPGVLKCAVVARMLETRKHQLHAFIQSEDGGALPQLRKQLSELVPAFMMPTVIHFLKIMPIRPNGKTDRVALQEMVQSPTTQHYQEDRPTVLQVICRQVAAILEMADSAVPVNIPFFEIGMDSMGAVKLMQELEKLYHANMPVSLLFDHPTPERLEAYINRLAENGMPSVAIGSEANASPATIHGNDIAVIGMSGRFPKAENVRRFWETLVNAENGVGEIPPERWSLEGFYDPDPNKKGTSYSKWAGLLDNTDQFEPLFFNLSPHEARYMDPQHRIMLMEAWNTLEDAGYTPEMLAQYHTGVYIGAKKGDYESLFDPEEIVPSAECKIVLFPEPSWP
jgi:acyl carrier protein